MTCSITFVLAVVILLYLCVYFVFLFIFIFFYFFYFTCVYVFVCLEHDFYNNYSSVVVLEESPCPRGSAKTSLKILVFVLGQ